MWFYEQFDLAEKTVCCHFVWVRRVLHVPLHFNRTTKR
jgi:hypothetical protein